MTVAEQNYKEVMGAFWAAVRAVKTAQTAIAKADQTNPLVVYDVMRVGLSSFDGMVSRVLASVEEYEQAVAARDAAKSPDDSPETA